MKKYFLISIIFLALFPISAAFAQCDTVADYCYKHLPPFLSDGQNYRALLVEDEVAEFNGTFFGGSTYRVSACSGIKDGSLIFSLYDKERNLLYTNEKYKNAPYWDFKFKSTIDCIIEAKLDKTKIAKSGCAVLLVGFKP